MFHILATFISINFYGQISVACKCYVSGFFFKRSSRMKLNNKRWMTLNSLGCKKLTKFYDVYAYVAMMIYSHMCML